MGLYFNFLHTHTHGKVDDASIAEQCTVVKPSLEQRFLLGL